MTTSAKPGHRNWFAWGVRKVALVVLGILIYCFCINMFAHYTTLAVAWIVIAAVSALAAVVWIRDERRGHSD